MTTTETIAEKPAKKQRRRGPNSLNGKNWLRPSKRLAIYIRDEYMCLCCGRDLRDSPPKTMCLDHLIPRSKGGTDDARNIVTICSACNTSRSDKPWRQHYPAERHAIILRNRKRKLKRALALSIIKQLKIERQNINNSAIP